MIVRRLIVTREWARGVTITTDSVAFSDSATRLAPRSRTTSDSIAFSDTATRVGAGTRATSDSIAFTDSA